ncbi:MAG: hypothetical protein IPO12_11300 [Flavobacteriales bacterium]|nr:hypothetical protein [Flavobacteriales bacterium]
MLVIALVPGCGTNKQVVDAPLRSADPRWAGVDPDLAQVFRARRPVRAGRATCASSMDH